jgi:hypothetical protein
VLLLNAPQVEPYFNETGSNCPSILPRQQQKELLELSVNSVKVRADCIIIGFLDFRSCR